MKCDKQCSYRTPYGYCSVTKCQTNLGTTYAEPRHLKKDMSEEYIWRINADGTDVKIQKIVRCKDCKWWRKDWIPKRSLADDVGHSACMRLNGIILMEEDDFCSKGEE